MVARIVYLLFNIYSLGLIIYVVCSWIPHPRVQAFRRPLGKCYEPFLDPLRREVGRLTKGNLALDFSPLLLLLAIHVLRWLVVSLLVLPF